MPAKRSASFTEYRPGPKPDLARYGTPGLVRPFYGRLQGRMSLLPVRGIGASPEIHKGHGLIASV